MRKRRSGSVIALLVALSAACWMPLAGAAVSAQLDRSRAAMGETLTLIISSDGEENPANTELAPLTADFDILQRASSNSMQIINGQTQRSRELRLELMPLRTGTLQIPALNVEGALTQPLEIEVSAAPDIPDSAQDVIFTAEVDSRSVYVQQQVILTLRVEQAINLDDRSISELELEQNAFVTPLGQNSYQRNRGGRRWLVNELRFAIFPQESGVLEIPAQTFVARERRPSRSLFDLSSGPRLQRRSEALQIDVKPRPDAFPAGREWLPAAQLTLEEQWSENTDSLAVGQSLTRTVIVRAEGLQGAQLPPLLFNAPDGIKYYPDQPSIEDTESDQGVLGMRVDNAALVPVQAGTYTVPEVRIPWWDTQTDSLRYATLPARTLEVRPAPGTAAGEQAAVAAPSPGQAASAPVPAPDRRPQQTPAPLGSDSAPLLRWQIATAVCALGWLATLLLWWWRRPASARSTNGHVAPPGEKLRHLRRACRDGDARAARNALQTLLQARADYRRSDTPLNYARRQPSEALLAALQALDQALYSPHSAAWEGSELMRAVESLPPVGARPRRSAPPQALAPLYPGSASSAA